MANCSHGRVNKNVMPRFTRVDRYPTSASLSSALNRLLGIGVLPQDIRIEFGDFKGFNYPQVVYQKPDPGEEIHFGQEIVLGVNVQRLVDIFPEGLFVNKIGKAGRMQISDANRLFAPFDKARNLAVSKLRHWNEVFSGCKFDSFFEEFLWEALGYREDEMGAAREIFDSKEYAELVRFLPHIGEFSKTTSGVESVLRHFLGLVFEFCPSSGMSVELDSDYRFRLSMADHEIWETNSGAPANSAILGRAFLGKRVSLHNAVMRLRVGPLSHSEFQEFMIPELVGEFGETLRVNLGKPCQFAELYNSLLKSNSPWPRLLFLLELLIPLNVHLTVEVLAKKGPGWRLGLIEEWEGFGPSLLGVHSRIVQGSK